MSLFAKSGLTILRNAYIQTTTVLKIILQVSEQQSWHDSSVGFSTQFEGRWSGIQFTAGARHTQRTDTVPFSLMLVQCFYFDVQRLR